MSGPDVLGGISAVIAIIDACVKVYKGVSKDLRLPEAFAVVARRLPVLADTLQTCRRHLEPRQNSIPRDVCDALQKTLASCEEKARILQLIGDKVIVYEGDGRMTRYKKIVSSLGKGNTVEELMKVITEDVQHVVNNDAVQSAAPEQMQQLSSVLQDLHTLKPSLVEEDGLYIRTKVSQTGDGQQWITEKVDTMTLNFGTLNVHETRRACLKALQCPNSFKVKNRLKQTNGELLYDSFKWIFSDTQYLRWHNGDDIGLLWIKGGAGKGKTMMSIGLVEELLRRQRQSTIVTYFFCQNADSSLNTVTAIIKGLILRLIEQRETLYEVLVKRWDTRHACFDEDLSVWQNLWNIFLEMVLRCRSSGDAVFAVVDALDECPGEGTIDFLQALVHTGLDAPEHFKWLLTSRPLQDAEHVLIANVNRAHISFELNSKHVAAGIRIFIEEQVRKLLERKERRD